MIRTADPTTARDRLVNLIKDPRFVAGISTLALLLAGNLISPGFASPGQIVNMLTVAAFLGIISAGQTLVVMGGGTGIDLSVGKMVTLGAVIGGAIMAGRDGGIIPALVAVLVVTFAIGCISGLGITFIGIPPLVMTLSMSIVVAAGIQFITGGVPVEGAPPFLKNLVIGRVAGIPGILFFWAAIAVVIIYLLNRTRYGAMLTSAGDNDRAAFLSGVHVRPLRTITYGFSAALSGFAGFLYLGYVGSVYNITLGDGYTLPSVAAVVIGGVSLAGGKGSYVGVIISAILLQILESVLITINIEQFGRNIIFGLVILLLMLAYGREKRLRL